MDDPLPVIVREASGFGGPCAVLGTFVSETSTRYIYRRRPDGPLAFACKRSPALHTEPCNSCPDHPASRYGNLREDTSARDISKADYNAIKQRLDK
jgi:hypothetical protein